eukprot:765440-Hanusia_phi.AAC.4
MDREGEGREGKSRGRAGQSRAEQGSAAQSTERSKTMRRTSPTLPLLVALPLLATLLLVVHISQGPHRTALVATQQASQAQAQSHLFWGDALKDDDESGEWRDSDEHLQSMANDALDLCDEVVAGGQQQEASRVKHCVHRVVPEELTRFWHTPAGLDDWTQPTKAKDEWGDEVAVGREHNYARSLQKIIDQFQPHTSWEGKKIYEDGKMVYIPRYDRSAFQGYSGADTRASFLFNTKVSLAAWERVEEGWKEGREKGEGGVTRVGGKV